MFGRSLYRRLLWPGLIWLMATVLALPKVLAGLDGVGLPAETEGYLRDAAAAISWLSAAWIGERLFRLMLNRGGRQVPRLLGDMVTIGLFITAVIVVLASVFHQPVGALITTSGVLVAVLGFSVRDLIGDIFAGVSINMECPYSLGDWLEIPPSAQVGRVIEINWRATRLMTLDGLTVVIPNGLMARSRFTNYSKPRRSFRVLVPVILGFDVPPERAMALMTVALRSTPLVMSQPAADVRLESFTDHGIRYLARFWIADYELMLSTRSRALINIHRHLGLGGVPLRHGRQDMTIARAVEPSPDLDSRRIAVLRHVEMFRALTEGDLTQLSEGLTVRHESADTVVVGAGDAGSSLFVVVEGLLEVRRADGAVLATLGPGDVFGEMSLLTGAPRSATVVVATEAVLFEIFDRQLRPILHCRPDLADALGAIIEQRQRANRKRTDHAADDPTATAHTGQPLMVRIREFFGLVR